MALKVPGDSPLAPRLPRPSMGHSLLCFIAAAARKRGFWIVAACALACAWIETPVAFAQHASPVGGTRVGGGHVEGGHAGRGGQPIGGHVGAPHAAVPPAPHVTIPRPPMGFGPRVGFAPRMDFGPRPIFPRHRVFLRAPFFRLRQNFFPGWWLNCGYLWAWDVGCGEWRLPEFISQNYVTPLIYESPVYVYYGGDHEFVQLFLKDRTVYSVTDYWFVNDQVHFTALEEDGAKSVEQVIGLDELDLQKTISVNARRGFRVVRRDGPMEQYLRDHPDANPPLLEPQKN